MATSTTIEVPIIMNGVTGRMGTNQHLIRSILAIRAQGGLCISRSSNNTSNRSTIIMPRPILIGRSLSKIRNLAQTHNIPDYATTASLPDLLTSTVAQSPQHTIYFDAQTTAQRYAAVKQAIAAGAHVYCEKPLASTSAQALELHRLVLERGVKAGVVQDKLFLPGLRKLRRLLDEGFFGEVLSLRGEFGYWVFSGLEPDTVVEVADDDGGRAGGGLGGAAKAPQRPSWNYRAEEGGGIISDMLCHWQYLIEGLFGRIISLSCSGATHVKQRMDEGGRQYEVTADDSAYATFEVDSDGDRGSGSSNSSRLVAHFNSSWAVRVRRDDLLTLQVDGTKGSAVVGLREVWTQSAANTPRIVWNPDIKGVVDYWEDWERVGARTKEEGEEDECENGFKLQWEAFLRYVVTGEGEWKHDFLAGARGVMVTEAGERSWRERRWVDL